ncbi:MAG TPA: DUF3140 domain-containing protein [Micromonosporaceae bacterium]|nr:DUF3140 domain-containing protein [Micromonosporaceae bacterium]
MAHTREDPERDELWREFHRLVTMPSPELSDWLVETRDGVEIYASEPDVDVRELGDGVSRILAKRKVDLTRADEDLMATVVDEISQLLENPPSAGSDTGPWEDTLRTLGHDPLRESDELGANFDEQEEYPPER